MKSGIFPVSSLSDAHLNARKIISESYTRTPFSHQDIVQQCQKFRQKARKFLHCGQAL